MTIMAIGMIPESKSADSVANDGKERGRNSPEQRDTPPDGGWGWVVCLGALVVNFLTIGQQNSAGVVYSELLWEYSTQRGETGMEEICCARQLTKVDSNKCPLLISINLQLY